MIREKGILNTPPYGRKDVKTKEIRIGGRLVAGGGLMDRLADRIAHGHSGSAKSVKPPA